MGSPSRSFAAEAHLLLHGPDPARDPTEYKVAARASRPIGGLPSVRLRCQHPLCMPAFIRLDRRKPIQALTLVAQRRRRRREDALARRTTPELDNLDLLAPCSLPRNRCAAAMQAALGALFGVGYASRSRNSAGHKRNDFGSLPQPALARSRRRSSL